MENFCGEPNNLLEQLYRHFNYTQFKNDVQRQVIERVLAGNVDLFVRMSTGSGKSLCYQMPAVLQKGKITIVFAPLLSLIKDQIDHLKEYGIVGSTINSRMSNSEVKNIIQDLNSENPKISLLYLTPEGANSQRIKEIIDTLYNRSKLSYIVIDEAHCVYEWGLGFRPDYMNLGKLRAMYPDIPCIALTATATDQEMAAITSFLNLRRPVAVFRMPCFRSNIFLEVVSRKKANVYEDLKKFISVSLAESYTLNKKTSDGCGIIYCLRRRTTETVASVLRGMGVSCSAYHAEDGMWLYNIIPVRYTLPRQMLVLIELTCSLNAFLLHMEFSQKIIPYASSEWTLSWYIVTTGARLYFVRTFLQHIVLCDHVRHQPLLHGKSSFLFPLYLASAYCTYTLFEFVVHWNLPRTLSSFCQQAGRAGRDGKQSWCRVYYETEEKIHRISLIQRRITSYKSKCKKNNAENELKEFEKVVRYCEAVTCRHNIISEHFGDPKVLCNKQCDVCASKPPAGDAVVNLLSSKYSRTENCQLQVDKSTADTEEERSLSTICSDRFDDSLAEWTTLHDNSKNESKKHAEKSSAVFHNNAEVTLNNDESSTHCKSELAIKRDTKKIDESCLSSFHRKIEMKRIHTDDKVEHRNNLECNIKRIRPVQSKKEVEGDHIQEEYMKLKCYKVQLEILKLERELNVAPSPWTENFKTAWIYKGHERHQLLSDHYEGYRDALYSCETVL